MRARFDQWAKVRDINGEEGWIHRSLLSTRDFALIQANNERNYVILRKKKNPESAGVVRLEDDSLVRVHECSELYCKVGIAGYRGFLEKKVLLIDADPQANATSGLGVEVEEVSLGTYQLLEHSIKAEDAIITTNTPNQIDMGGDEV